MGGGDHATGLIAKQNRQTIRCQHCAGYTCAPRVARIGVADLAIRFRFHDLNPVLLIQPLWRSGQSRQQSQQTLTVCRDVDWIVADMAGEIE
jgi:hypothetical protein